MRPVQERIWLRYSWGFPGVIGTLAELLAEGVLQVVHRRAARRQAQELFSEGVEAAFGLQARQLNARACEGLEAGVAATEVFLELRAVEVAAFYQPAHRHRGLPPLRIAGAAHADC